MVKCSRKHISLAYLWVYSHDKISDFYLCSWQKGESALPMLLVRLLLALASLGIFIWSLTYGAGPYWMVFLTNWGIILITTMTLSGLFVSVMAYLRKIPDVKVLPWYVSVFWLFYNIGVTLAIMITGLYWILLYDHEFREDKSFWLDLSTHGFNSCIAISEVVLSRNPMRMVHLHLPLTVGFYYASFSGIYYAAGGTDSVGNPYIYEILDWRNLGRSFTVVAGSAACLIIVYMILWGLTKCRDWVSTALVRTTSLTLPLTPPDRHSGQIV